MTKTESLERLAQLLASAWHYGSWKAETINEREMQSLMERLGFWPYSYRDLSAPVEPPAKPEESLRGIIEQILAEGGADQKSHAYLGEAMLARIRSALNRHAEPPANPPRRFRGNGPDCLGCGKTLPEHLTDYHFCPGLPEDDLRVNRSEKPA